MVRAAPEKKEPIMAEVSRNKKGERIEVRFIGSAGEIASRPQSNTVSIKAVAKETGVEVEIDLASLPGEIKRMATAFGLAVLMRNEVNTCPDAQAAAEGLMERVEGLKSGNWASGARSIGTPIILRAFELALQKAGHAPERIASALAKNLSKWRGEGLALSSDPETAEKELKKHQSKMRAEFLAKTAIKEAVLELQTPKAPAEQAENLDSLL